MSNYPPGSETDPNAPWNAKEPRECEDCEGTGEIEIGKNGITKECSFCNGTGEIEDDDEN